MIETQKSKKLDYKGLNKEETKILKRMRKKNMQNYGQFFLFYYFSKEKGMLSF
jgi:hypothetical protein